MDKQTEEVGKEIAKTFVESFIHEPYLHKIGKTVSAIPAVHAGVIARILGLEDLVKQYEKFTRRASKRDIARQQLTKDLKILTFEEIDREFPVFDKERLIKNYLSHDQIFKHALTGNHDHARSLCTSEFDLEGLAYAQLVLGQFYEAKNTQKLIIKDEFRVRAVNEIKTVELWRCGHHDQAKQGLNALSVENLRPQLILCFLNREAWQVYPFSDW